MAGPWQSSLEHKFSTGGYSPSPGQVGMGAGGVPFASGLMAKPSVQPSRPEADGSPASMAPPSGSPPSQPPTGGQPAGPMGMGQPATPPEMQQAVMMTQQLIDKFRQLAERIRMQNQQAPGNPQKPGQYMM